MAESFSPGLILGCIVAGTAGLVVGKRMPQMSLCLIKYKEAKKGKAYPSYLFPEWRSWLYAVGLAAIWIWTMVVYWNNPLQTAFLAVLSTVAMVIIYIDNRYRIIANEITFPLMICGLVLNLAVGGVKGAAGSLAAAAIGFLLCMVSAAITRNRGAVGAGDVKLMMAAALVSGYPGFMYLLMFMAAAMGIYCVAGLCTRRLTLKSYFPMGGFIAAGMVFAFFEGSLMPWLYQMLR